MKHKTHLKIGDCGGGWVGGGGGVGEGLLRKKASTKPFGLLGFVCRALDVEFRGCFTAAYTAQSPKFTVD